MAKETTQAGILGELRRFQGALRANAAEVPHLEGTGLLFASVLDQATEISKQQAALTASRQAASKELQRLLGEGQRLATILRLGLKQSYGIRSEKLAEFHLQPFRGKTRVAKPGPEEPKLPPAETPSAPPIDTETAR